MIPGDPLIFLGDPLIFLGGWDTCLTTTRG